MSTSRSRLAALVAGAALLGGAAFLVRPAAGFPEPPPDPFAADELLEGDAGGPGHGPGPGGPGGPGRGRFERERIAVYLGLSEEQKATIRSLVEAHHAALQPRAEQRRALHEQLRTLMEQDNPDEAAIGSLMLQLRAQRRQLAEARDALADEIAGVLDAGQKVKWQHLRELREAGREAREGRGRRG